MAAIRANKTSPWAMVALAAALTAAGCGTEDAPATPSPSPNPFDATFTISGRLLQGNGTDVVPLPGATATLTGTSMNAETFLGWHVLTDADGWYRFPDVPVGIYEVRPSMSGRVFVIGGWSGIIVRDHDVELGEIMSAPAPAP